MEKTSSDSHCPEQLLENSAPLSIRHFIAAALISGVSFGCNRVQPPASTPSPDEVNRPASTSGSQVFTTPKMTPADRENTHYVPFNNVANEPSTEEIRSDETNSIPVFRVPEMIIVAKAPNGPWPKVPKDCVYTGIIREYDTNSDPHFIVLENMCLQGMHPYNGYHVTVQADEQGRYELPFYDVHLEERGRELYFVMDTRERISQRVHAPASYEPGVCSFQNYLKIFGIRDKD